MNFLSFDFAVSYTCMDIMLIMFAIYNDLSVFIKKIIKVKLIICESLYHFINFDKKCNTTNCWSENINIRQNLKRFEIITLKHTSPKKLITLSPSLIWSMSVIQLYTKPMSQFHSPPSVHRVHPRFWALTAYRGITVTWVTACCIIFSFKSVLMNGV